MSTDTLGIGPSGDRDVGAATVAEDVIGRTFAGRYLVRRRIGEGGSGVVYEALDRRLGTSVAIKILRPELRQDASFMRELVREARTISQMQHPHVLRVFDLPDLGPPIGRALVMEYARNGSLKRLIRPGSPLEDAQVVRIGVEAASALSAAHAHGLVHRDVKPGNLLLDEGGHIRLADFGLAWSQRGTEAARQVGTPRYMAPEQVTGEPITPAVDVYALALVLYELVVGSVPFQGQGTDPVELARARLLGDVANPEPGRPLLDVLVAALKRDAGQRPGAADFEARLAELARVLPPPAPLPLDAPPTPEEILDGSSLSVVIGPESQGHTAALVPDRTQLGLPSDGRHRRRWLRAGGFLALVVVLLALAAGWFLEVRSLLLPRVAGERPQLALARLHEAGFFRVRSERLYDAAVPAGIVVGTLPPAGRRTHALSPIALVISRGHAPVAVPDVVGFTLADARRAFVLAGLAPRVTRAYSNSVATGVVLADPQSGHRVPWRSSVTLVVSAGPPPRPVPAVTGESAQAATSALTAAGFGVQSQSAYSASVAKGDVVSESPAAGTTAAYGSRVTIVVSLGPPDVAVPDLLGDTFQQAASALADVGLRYGQLATPGGIPLNAVASYLGPSVVVVSQSVTSGTEVPVGSAVNLVLAPAS